jgi:hypothetical protein
MSAATLGAQALDEGLLQWRHGAFTRPDRSVGEVSPFFDDFEVDEENSDPMALGLFEALPRVEQERIEERAHQTAMYAR